MTRTNVPREVPNLLSENIETMRVLFPQAFSEGKIDFEKLRTVLGDNVESGSEKFTFSWAGKRNAIQILQMPTRATLKPLREESVGFDQTKHLFIEGDNLEVMKLLYKPYFGRIKMIYIDPPYNTGNDFVYQDNYADPLATYLKLTKQKSVEGNLLTSNPETSGRYHSAWLSMMYPRLFLSKQLLSEDGVIFVSIDDHEMHNLRLMMNEIFGEENFLATFVWRRRTPSALAEKLVSVDHEYVVSYQHGGFSSFLGEKKDYASYSNPDNDPRGDWMLDNLTVGMTKEQRPNQFYELIDPKTGKVYPANPNRVWGFIPSTMKKLIAAGRIWFPDDSSKRPLLKRYKKDLKTQVNPVSTWIKNLRDNKNQSNLIELEAGLNAEGTRELQELFGETVFNYAKPVSLIYSLARYCTSGDDIVLDPFAGSCTTAQAVMELNSKDGGDRRFICIQLQEPFSEPKRLRDGTMVKTIADIGKERIRRVIKKIKGEKKANVSLVNTSRDRDLGFRVFKLSESNYKPWKGVEEKTTENYSAQMETYIDALVKNWKQEDVVFEVALKEGLGLVIGIRHEDMYKDNEIYHVKDDEKEQSFLICLDDKIKISTVKQLEVTKDDTFVCRDISIDDTMAANLALSCRLKTI